MSSDICNLRIGLFLSMLAFMLGIPMGVLVGASEDGVKDFISIGIATHQPVHDKKSHS